MRESWDPLPWLLESSAAARCGLARGWEGEGWGREGNSRDSGRSEVGWEGDSWRASRPSTSRSVSSPSPMR